MDSPSRAARRAPSSSNASRGQAIVLVALGMAAFLGFLGLALDGGSAYLEQQRQQRASDLAGLSGAWVYYHALYQDSDGFGGSVSGAMASAQDTVVNVLAANGYPGAVVTRGPEGPACPGGGGTEVCLTFLDQAGNPASGQCDPGCPAATEVRGLSVHVTRVLNPQVTSTLAAGGITVGATSSAMLGDNTGAGHEAPLLVQNYVDAAHNLPRVSGYATCTPVLPDGARYPLVPDCRPSTGGSWPAQPLNLVPAWEASPPAPGPGFATAPTAVFSLLHDDPSSAAAPATSTTVQSGIPHYLQTCSAQPCSAAIHYYTDIAPAADPVYGGLSARIATAGAAPWAAQSCAIPLDPTNPLAPDNPRLMRLPVTYAGPSGGQAWVSETVMFCLDNLAGAPGAYVVSGYLVEKPTSEPTVLAAADPYFGRDVTVRLTR